LLLSRSQFPDRIEAGRFLWRRITGGGTHCGRCNRSLGRSDGQAEETRPSRYFLAPTGCAARQRGGGARQTSQPKSIRLSYRYAGAIHGTSYQAKGVSVIEENIFENRFMHVQELARMGANIKVKADGHPCAGRKALRRGRHVLWTAGFGIARAGCLVADGESILDRVYQHGSRI